MRAARAPVPLRAARRTDDGAVRLLVVEDEQALADVVSAGLLREGFAVDVAPDGHRALELAADGSYDVIVLDLRLPGMDGWQFRASQLADPALAGIPVLLLSGQPDLPQEAAALGAAGYLRKPVGAEDLVAAVEQCCRAAAPAP